MKSEKSIIETKCKTDDLRWLLLPLATRKPSEWNETAHRRDLSKEFLEVFKKLPVIETDKKPFEEFIEGEPPIECVVVYEGRTFYVDTEGYHYARYALEFSY